MNYDTLIKQYMRKVPKDLRFEFFEYCFGIINNLLETDIPKNRKLILINYLMNEKCIIFFKNSEDELLIGRYGRALTYDEDRLPIDVQARTLNGKSYDLLKGEYVMLYNPIPVTYLHLKLDEMAKNENITNYRRKLYKVPVVFKGKASAIQSIKRFITNLFYNTEEVCTVAGENSFRDDQLSKLDLDIEYITDKLLDENESIKEDILEILGIYKNTSGNRERVNETELMVANSNTSVNKLGLEQSLKNTYKEVKEVLGLDYKIELNINKVFDMTKGSDESE